MRFPAASIVREAISYAILDCVLVSIDPQEVPQTARLKTLFRYSHIFLWSEARDIADDVRDWFLANGPFAGDVSKTKRRLMLALWQPEKFQ